MVIIGIQLKSLTTHPGLVINVAMQQKQRMSNGDTSRKDHQATTNIFTNMLAEDWRNPSVGKKSKRNWSVAQTAEWQYWIQGMAESHKKLARPGKISSYHSLAKMGLQPPVERRKQKPFLYILSLRPRKFCSHSIAMNQQEADLL